MNNEELHKEIRQIDARLDAHIEAYAKNGRELVRLSNIIEKHIEMDVKQWNKMEPIINYWNGFKFGRKFIIGSIGFFSAIGGAILLWREINK